MLIDVLTSADDVREMARVYLPWLIISPLIAVWSFQLDGIYIGATQSTAMRNMMIISMVVFYISLWLLVPAMGNRGLWLALKVFLPLMAEFFGCGIRGPNKVSLTLNNSRTFLRWCALKKFPITFRKM